MKIRVVIFYRESERMKIYFYPLKKKEENRQSTRVYKKKIIHAMESDFSLQFVELLIVVWCATTTFVDE